MHKTDIVWEFSRRIAYRTEVDYRNWSYFFVSRVIIERYNVTDSVNPSFNISAIRRILTLFRLLYNLNEATQLKNWRSHDSNLLSRVENRSTFYLGRSLLSYFTWHPVEIFKEHFPHVNRVLEARTELEDRRRQQEIVHRVWPSSRWHYYTMPHARDKFTVYQ